MEIDPRFAGGYAGAAYVHILRYGNPMPPGRSAETELKAAIQLGEKAVALDPSFGPAWGGLGEAYARAHRHDDALKAIRQAVKLAPNDSLMRAT